MINAIIIEDEEIAAQRLIQLIGQVDSKIKVTRTLATNKEAIAYLSQHTPDLIFLDINLTDGISFEIFENIKKTIPIIFITAYSQYSLKAFEQFSIDYLLKPISTEALKRSIDKFKKLGKDQIFNYDELLERFDNRYKSRFLVKWNNRLLQIEIKDIAYFFSEDKLTFIRNWNGHNYPLEHSLKYLESELDPKKFFRINKKYLIHHKAIRDMYYTSKSRLKVQLVPENDDEHIFVAIEKLGIFKTWLSG